MVSLSSLPLVCFDFVGKQNLLENKSETARQIMPYKAYNYRRGTTSCCRKDCLKTIPQDELAKFRQSYESCKLLLSRTAFIASYVSQVPVLDSHKKVFNNHYRIGTRSVCAQSFSKGLGISTAAISTATQKCRDGFSIMKEDECPHKTFTIVRINNSTGEEECLEENPKVQLRNKRNKLRSCSLPTELPLEVRIESLNLTRN